MYDGKYDYLIYIPCTNDVCGVYNAGGNYRNVSRYFYR